MLVMGPLILVFWQHCFKKVFSIGGVSDSKVTMFFKPFQPCLMFVGKSKSQHLQRPWQKKYENHLERFLGKSQNKLLIKQTVLHWA